MTDVRLVAPALVAWASSAAVLTGLSEVESAQTRHFLAVRVLQVCVVSSVVVAATLRRRIGPMVMISAGILAAVAAAAQVSAWTSPALQQFMGTQVQMVAVVDGPPREALGVQYLPVSSVRMAGDSTVALSVPVSVVLDRFTDVPDSGSTVFVQGRLRPAGGSLHAAAYLDSSEEMTITAQPGLIDRAAQRIRDSLHASLPAHPVAGAALVAGLAIGDETTMPPELVEQMRMSGLSHLTAVSGGNVAIVVGAVIGLAWLLRVPMLGRIAAALACLVFYVIVVHPQPSVLRAAVMGAVVVVSLLVGGRRPGPSVLATAVLVLVVTVPSLAVSWGFVLSVAATAGIVMLMPGIRRSLEQRRWGMRVPTAVVIAASLTLAAQVATAPVLLAMGAYVSIAAIPANLLAMPVVPLVTIAGLGAALLGVVPGLRVLTDPLAWIGAVAGEWIAFVAVRAATVDVLRIRGSPTAAIVIIVVAGVAVVIWRRGSWPLRLGVTGCVVVLASLWAIAPPDRRAWPPARWAVVQCDVGQGDGLVIAPSGGAGAVVVDTGISARVIDRCLEDLGIDQVAALVLTHFHADHVNGLAGVLDGRNVGAVFSTIAFEPGDQAAGVLHELRRRGIEVRTLRAGMRFGIGTGPDAGDYRVIWPRRIISAGRISEGSLANNASLVIDARVHGLRMLLTGDIEPPAQAAILAEAGDFDVVKVPHHGSRHQHPGFAAWASADVAVVSVGADNEFGHPAPETVRSWEESGAQVLRTDVNGDIAILIDDTGRLAWVGRRSSGHDP